MLTRHAHNRRNRNRLLRGRAPRRGGSAPLTLRQQIGAILGVEPQVFADARELTVGDGEAVTTWGDWDTSGGVNTFDVDGWRGILPAVDVTDGFTTAAEAANYNHLTPRVWGVSLIGSNPGVIRMFLGISTGAGVGNNTAHLFANGSNVVAYRTRESPGNQDNDSFVQLNTESPVHLILGYDGETARLVLLDANGMTAHSAPHGIATTVTYSLMHLANISGLAAATGDYAVSFMARVSAGVVTQQNLQETAALVNEHYPVA